MPEKQDIRELSKKEIEMYLTSIGEKTFRATQIWDWLWKKVVFSFDEMTDLSKSVREKLNEHFYIKSIPVETKIVSKDRSQKFTFLLDDGNRVEGVLIPSHERFTACISTQVGCPMGCRFCSTATMGFIRNLTFTEIFFQVYWLNKTALEGNGTGLSNIVIMGMGEPLMNYESVIAAIDRITAGFEMSPKRITLSTIGIPAMIRKLADDNVRINLAVSLHAASDEKRTKLIPYNKKASVDQLNEVLKYYCNATGEKITLEYVLLRDVNDTLQDAKDLVKFCSTLNCKVNLIEYNAGDDETFQKASPENADFFKNFLEKKRIIVNLRKSRGEDIFGACGQLANKISKSESL